MFKNLTNFTGVNWWVILGGMGMNFIVALIIALLGTYFSVSPTTADLYQQLGIPFMILLVFGACVFAGYITGKLADEEPLKHAFWASVGAAGPFFFVGLITINPVLFLVAAIATLGALNGGMLAMPRRRYGPPPEKK